MNPTQTHELFRLLHTQNPNARIELDHENPFHLLIAVVLSAQATDKQVNKITPPIFEVIKNPQNVIDLGHNWLREKLSSINYNNTKAKNIFTASQQLIENFGGEVPRTLAELETLAGVGRKSANVILNSCFGIPTLAVDTHVFRVCNRTGLAKAKTVIETETQVFPKLPKEFELSAHHLLVLHGRYVCKARKPECGKCVISHLCPSFEA